MEEFIRKADVLIEALPYIKAFQGKIPVIKYGGSILTEDSIRRDVLEDVVFLNFIGLKPVLVHGGGPNISSRMRELGLKSDFVDGMRITNKGTLKIVEEELGKLSAKIVGEIKALGGKAIGLKGDKDNIIRVKKKKGKKNLGFVGEIVSINKKIILECLEKNSIVVVSPIGTGEDKKTYNVNADEAAAEIAGILKAEKLVLFTNVKGIMRRMSDASSLISSLTVKEIKRLIKEKVIQAGMIPKVNACIKGLKAGVNKTHIIDAKISHALLLEIFTDKGIGTEIIQ